MHFLVRFCGGCRGRNANWRGHWLAWFYFSFSLSGQANNTVLYFFCVFLKEGMLFVSGYLSCLAPYIGRSEVIYRQ